MWIFGYGSLIFRPGFPTRGYIDGYIRGYSRRFWQASTDHRGVPERPGQVVTLVDAPEAICWGRAWQVAEDELDAVLDGLDEREKGGYERRQVDVYGQDHDLLAHATVYIASPENPQFRADLCLEEIAAIIAVAEGPSGRNADYLFRLAEALRQMGAQDLHVFELENLVRALKD